MDFSGSEKHGFRVRHRLVTAMFVVLTATLAWAAYDVFTSTEKSPRSSTQTAARPTPIATATVKMTIAGSNAMLAASGSLTVTGTITNNEQDKHGAIIRATFYDKGGKAIGTATGDAGYIQPGQTKPFSFTAPASVQNYYRMVVEVNSIS